MSEGVVDISVNNFGLPTRANPSSHTLTEVSHPDKCMLSMSYICVSGSSSSIPSESVLPLKMVAAGVYHTVLLRSDGAAVAFGSMLTFGQCNIPALEGDLTYNQAAAGIFHTVLLRSDGTAVACGGNANGQCNIPELEGDLTYIQAAAAGHHTVLLRSDGTALACGNNDEGQ